MGASNVLFPVLQTRDEEDALRAVLSRGACVGYGPDEFDDFEGPRVPVALAACKRCAVSGECLTLVKPSDSYYTGVCGGIVWKEGRRYA